MSPLSRLLLGHLIGDFVLQTIGLVHYKSHSWKGLLLHAGIVTASSAVCLLDLLPAWWYWLLALLAWHVFTDWLKIVLTRRLHEHRLGPFLFDQAMHVGAIVVVVFLGQGARLYPSLAEAIGGGSPAINRAILFGMALLVVVFVVPLLEVQVAFRLSRTFSAPSGGNSLGATLLDRLWGGFERGVALVLLYLALSGIAMWPVALAPLAFVPRIVALRPTWRQPDRAPAYRFKIATSIGCTVLLGVLLWAANPYL